MFRDVLEFHLKFGCKVGSMPALPDPTTFALRKRLIEEEVTETLNAMEAGDLPGVADGIADAVYVLLGCAVTYGVDLREIWDAVHEANMAKVGGTRRADGKVMKPPGWVPPDVAGILARQGTLKLLTENHGA